MNRRKDFICFGPAGLTKKWKSKFKSIIVINLKNMIESSSLFQFEVISKHKFSLNIIENRDKIIITNYNILYNICDLIFTGHRIDLFFRVAEEKLGRRLFYINDA